MKYFSIVNQKKMMAISEENWERAFRAVKEMFEIANSSTISSSLIGLE